MSWQKVKIGDLVENFSVRKKDINIKDIDLKFYGVSNVAGIINAKSEAQDKIEDYKIVKKGCFAYNPYRINVGSIGYYDKEDIGLISPAYVVFKTKPNLINDYLLFKFLKSQNGLNQIKINARGTVRKALRFEDLCKIRILINTDINEQKKIVKQLQDSESLITKLNNQTQNQLEQVKKLREAFLQEAISGQLIDESKIAISQTGKQLLAQIKAEKERLIKEKKIKKSNLSKKSINIFPSDCIPSKWCLCKVDDIFFVTKLAGFEYTKYFNLSEQGDIPVVRAQNVKNMSLKKENILYIDSATSILLERSALNKTCLLITFIGAGIGDVAIFNEKIRWHLAPNVAKAELFSKYNINLKFINYFLVSNLGRKEIFKHIKATAQPSLSMSTIRDINIPLPPLEIQQAIVAKLDNLMTYCDKLEQQIKTQQLVSEQLEKGILSELLKN